MNESSNFIKRGFTNNFKIDLGKKLEALQYLIYDVTKDLIIEHNKDIPIVEKIKLPFKSLPSNDKWSELMKTVNSSAELKKIIESNEVKSTFGNIFQDPILFEISTFRARFPQQNRVVYNWHQDEGTWYLSKNSNVTKKYPATLWFSINGADTSNSIQLIPFSHIKKLFYHEWVSGQGYFKINETDKNLNLKEIYTVNLEASECFIFHPLTIHRSVPSSNNLDLKPRYSIDIRYYDKNYIPKINADFKFNLKKYLKNFL